MRMREEVTVVTVETREYIAEDGRKFSTVEACERYEQALRVQAIRRQILRVTVELDDDPTRGFPYDNVQLVAIQTVEQWEAWTGHTFPTDRHFEPFVILEYSEEIGGRCGGREYDTRVMKPSDFANTLDQQAQRIRQAVTKMSRPAKELKDAVDATP